MTVMTKEDAKRALSDLIRALREAETQREMPLADAIAAAGNDMVRRMQLVYPILTKIQMQRLRDYGFSSDTEGLLKFCQEIATLERDDAEIKNLNDDLRQIFFPRTPALSTARFGS